MVVIEEQQSGTGVDIPAGELLAVRLKENPATGYRWMIEQANDLTVEEQANDINVPGAGRLHEFRFRAAVPGSRQLRLRHWRDWEGESSIIGHFVLDAHFR